MPHQARMPRRAADHCLVVKDSSTIYSQFIAVSCLVPHEGTGLEETQIRDFLKTHLAGYKVPRRSLFLWNRISR